MALVLQPKDLLFPRLLRRLWLLSMTDEVPPGESTDYRTGFTRLDGQDDGGVSSAQTATEPNTFVAG